MTKTNIDNPKKHIFQSKRLIESRKSILPLNKTQEESKNRLIEKLDSGEYQYEEYICECGSTAKDFEVIAKRDRYGLPVETKICTNCGLLMTNPRMNQDSYNNFYSYEYRGLYGGNPDADEDFFQDQVKHGEAIIDYIKNNTYISKIKTVLEIGCGAGGILYAFYKQGFDVTGVDLGDEYLNYGRKYGLNLHKGNSTQLIPKKYDLIILSHVLEHFLDLKSELKTIAELLTDEGILYVEVPGIKAIKKNYRSDILLYLQNAHIRHFTLNTLNQTMMKYNFNLISGDEEIHSLFIILRI
ncbi:class I SAM-dependent methyltransferase [Methanocorpusculum sp.]|nr:class I SAM-dependent methyltransferase [Methanocorpusculum sp.]